MIVSEEMNKMFTANRLQVEMFTPNASHTEAVYSSLLRNGTT